MCNLCFESIVTYDPKKDKKHRSRLQINDNSFYVLLAQIHEKHASQNEHKICDSSRSFYWDKIYFPVVRNTIQR